jgi:hypothetical protein
MNGFYSIALQMAAEEARLGHAKFVDRASKLVDEVRARASQPTRPRPIPIVQPQGELLVYSVPHIQKPA